MAYDANGMWTPEDDSSATKLTGMLATDSPYLQQARASGVRTAQARGLQNSTLAATAGESAAIGAAAPFAQQDAGQTFQKNLSFQGFGQQGKLLTQQGDQQKTLTQMQIDDAEKRQAADITAQGQRQQADLAATGQRQQVDVGAQADRQRAQIASNETISDRDAQSKLVIAQLGEDSKQMIAQMNVTANAQDKAQAAATNAANIYTQNINAIIGNPNIPADARAALMENAKSALGANIGMIETLYNIDLRWEPPAAPAAATSYGDVSQTPVTQAAANYGEPSPAPSSSSGQVAYTDDGGNQYDEYGNYLGTR